MIGGDFNGHLGEGNRCDDELLVSIVLRGAMQKDKQ